jgi:hypothetical protein
MLNKILICLDTLLDTRIGTVARLNQDAARLMLSNTEYHNRDFNDWGFLTQGLVTNEQFAEAYATRGGENTNLTLAASFETGMQPVIDRLLIECSVLARDQLVASENEVAIAINTWPYDLNAQQEEDLLDIMHAKFGRELPIELVEISLDELTPQVMYACFAMFVSYHFVDWFKHHYLAILQQYMSCFQAIMPILFETDPGKLTAQEREFEYTKLRHHSLEHLDIQFISARCMSLFQVDA